jgi:hypothetical protein
MCPSFRPAVDRRRFRWAVFGAAAVSGAFFACAPRVAVRGGNAPADDLKGAHTFSIQDGTVRYDSSIDSLNEQDFRNALREAVANVMTAHGYQAADAADVTVRVNAVAVLLEDHIDDARGPVSAFSPLYYPVRYWWEPAGDGKWVRRYPVLQVTVDFVRPADGAVLSHRELECEVVREVDRPLISRTVAALFAKTTPNAVPARP